MIQRIRRFSNSPLLSVAWVQLLCIYCLFSGIFSWAAIDDNQIPHLWAGVGALNQNTARYSSSPTGTSSPFSSLYAEVYVAARLGGAEWAFSPLLTYTPLGHSSSDGSVSNLMRVGLRGVKSFGPFELLVGVGDLLYWVGGSGGTVVLNNGTASSSFGVPASKSLTSQFYIDAGAGMIFLNRFRFDANINMVDLLSSARRSVNGVASIGIGFL
jgi:hypothetical protein